MKASDLYHLYLQHPCITTDSRDCPPGSIFIALKGNSFNGNRFAASALEKGCSFAIVDEAEYADPADERFIIVDDGLTAFKELAREHRRQFNIPVIGITGTNGKTTTKELLSAVLAQKFNVMHTEGNYNNDVGVPKTLLRLNRQHEIAIIEMGASHPGDIRKLAEYAEPTCGLITNVGRAHLQGFGSFEGVKKTKGELYDFLKSHDRLVFLNSAGDDLVQMARDRKLPRIITYGTADARINGHVVACDPFLRFEWTDNCTGQTFAVRTNLIGAYNLDNALAAITIGLHYGVPVTEINSALEAYMPTNNRSELLQTSNNLLIIDAYNANPTSMAAAIDNFEKMDVPQPKMLILGDMHELGTAGADEHRKIVDRLKQGAPKEVWLVGQLFADTPCDFRKFRTTEELRQTLKAQPIRGYCILIKGSNSTRLYELTDIL